MFKILMVVPVLSNFKGFTELMASVQSEHKIDPFVIKNWQYNQGVPVAWNKGLEYAAENYYSAVMFVNDDVVLGDKTIDTMVSIVSRDPLTIVTARDALHPQYDKNPGFWCFMMDPQKSLRYIGKFDENFSPAYYEDNDYLYRANLVGFKKVMQSSAEVAHDERGTQGWDWKVVTKEMWKNNLDYYIRKWGGKPGNEKFTSPFNDPEKSVRWGLDKHW